MDDKTLAYVLADFDPDDWWDGKEIVYRFVAMSDNPDLQAMIDTLVAERKEKERKLTAQVAEQRK